MRRPAMSLAARMRSAAVSNGSQFEISELPCLVSVAKHVNRYPPRSVNRNWCPGAGVLANDHLHAGGPAARLTMAVSAANHALGRNRARRRPAQTGAGNSRDGFLEIVSHREPAALWRRRRRARVGPGCLRFRHDGQRLTRRTMPPERPCHPGARHQRRTGSRSVGRHSDLGTRPTIFILKNLFGAGVDKARQARSSQVEGIICA